MEKRSRNTLIIIIIIIIIINRLLFLLLFALVCADLTLVFLLNLKTPNPCPLETECKKAGVFFLVTHIFSASFV